MHDVARANVIAATQASVPTGVANICTGRPASLNEVLDALRPHFPPVGPARHAPARAGDIRDSWGRPDRARAELGFAARVELATGLGEWAAGLGRGPVEG